MSETFKCGPSKPVRYSIPCIICGEYVTLNDMENMALTLPYSSMYKVCDKCREAVMMMRNLQKSEVDAIDKEFNFDKAVKNPYKVKE